MKAGGREQGQAGQGSRAPAAASSRPPLNLRGPGSEPQSSKHAGGAAGGEAGEAEGEGGRDEDEDEDDEDFMSDAVLARVLAAAPPTSDNRTGRRGGTRADTTAQQHPSSRSERERAARKSALARNLIEEELERLKGQPDRKLEDRAGGDDGNARQDGSGSPRGAKRRRLDTTVTGEAGSSVVKHSGASAALLMMMSMGYQHGAALGAANSSGAREASKSLDPSEIRPSGSDKNTDQEGPASGDTEPLAVDDRWLAHGNRSSGGSLVRFGLGNAAVQRIRATSANDAAAQTQAQDQADVAAFRSRRAQEEKVRHAEALLHSARRTCEELDRRKGIDFSVLWLDPHWLRPEARPTDDQLELLEQAFGEDEAPPAHRDLDEVERRDDRRKEAEAFCLLDPVARLARTTAHLRTTHRYCLFCGCSYPSGAELDAQCPGEDEDDH